MPASKPTVGVVMTMIDLYRQVVPEWEDRLQSHWRAALEDVIGPAAGLHFAGVAYTAPEVVECVKSCTEAGADALIVLPLAYAPSGAAIRALSASRLPLILVDSARDATLPYDMGDDQVMANHAIHGIQDLTNVLAREGRDYAIVAGHPSQPRFRDRLIRAVRVAAGAAILRRGRVGRIGSAFEDMLDFEPGEGFAGQFGMDVFDADPEELAEAARSVATGRVNELELWARTEFDVSADLTGVELTTSCRWALALEDVVDAGSLDAVSMNFLALAQEEADTMPFLGAGRLMARGVGYAGEGDILTAALVAALARFSDGATFTEMFCPDYARNEVLLSHMGECNIALASPARRIRLVAKPFVFGKCERPAVPVFQLRPGPVVLSCLTQWPGEGFRLVAADGEIIDAPDHPNLRSPYSRIRFGRDLAPFLEDFSRAGGMHHLALAYGLSPGDLETLARFLGIGFTRA